MGRVPGPELDTPILELLVEDIEQRFGPLSPSSRGNPLTRVSTLI